MASSFTKQKLRKELAAVGVSVPSTALKEDCLKLYEEHVINAHNNDSLLDGDFSTDDELPVEHSPAKHAARSKKKHTESATMSNSTEEVSVNGISINELSDDELYDQLKDLGYDVGPVLETTREVYKKILAKALKEGIAKHDGGGDRAFTTQTEEAYSDSDIEEVQQETPKAREEHKSSVYRRSYAVSGRNFDATSSWEPITSRATYRQGTASSGYYLAMSERSSGSEAIPDWVTQTSTKPPAPKPSSNSFGKKILLQIVLFLVIVGVLAFFFLSWDGEQQQYDEIEAAARERLQ